MKSSAWRPTPGRTPGSSANRRSTAVAGHETGTQLVFGHYTHDCKASGSACGDPTDNDLEWYEGYGYDFLGRRAIKAGPTVLTLGVQTVLTVGVQLPPLPVGEGWGEGRTRENAPHIQPSPRIARAALPLTPFRGAGEPATVYDYDMLSQNVLATRTGDKSFLSNGNFQWDHAERFTATFFYGAMGVVSRVDEKGDSDVTNNDENYYLTDATGNHVGMAVVNGSQRDAQFQYFDAL